MDFMGALGEKTLLHGAAKRGEDGAIRELVGSDRGLLDRKNRRGRTALHLAICNGHVETALTLLELGASVLSEDVHGETPLHDAAFRGLTPVVIRLVALGALLNKVSRWRLLTPIHAAVLGHQPGIITTLVALGASVGHIAHVKREPPQYSATMMGDLETMYVLFKVGFNMWARTHGSTLVECTMFSHQAARMKLLMHTASRDMERAVKEIEYCFRDRGYRPWLFTRWQEFSAGEVLVGTAGLPAHRAPRASCCAEIHGSK